TYTYPRDTTKEQAYQYWMKVPQTTLVAEDDGVILGTYYIKPNQLGGGAHVCNCGYMVSPQARGRGLASAMCEHSQQLARELGFRAMQFNFVVASNTTAVALWAKLGFETLARLPEAFLHPSLGYVDALVMHKRLV
ncbi:MAG: GNAT family N-acetyltransferase, partial [Burkholderiaceae bacterium]